jgi:hypothetical protein
VKPWGCACYIWSSFRWTHREAGGLDRTALEYRSAHAGMSATIYWGDNKLGASTGIVCLTAGSAFMLQCFVPIALGIIRR